MVWVIIIIAIVIVFLLARASTRRSNPTDSSTSIGTGPPARTPSRTHPGEASTRRPGTGPAGASPPRTYTRPRASTATTARPAREDMPFAAPSMRGKLFTYGGPASRGSRAHTGSYAVIDVETTGLAPGRGDRVIEIAVARVDAHGRIEDEFATLINPEGRDTGPVFIHGISNDAVKNAPTFAEVAPELLARLDGAVVVAHNAPFEERFLGVELARSGHTGLRMPALCTLWLGRQTFSTPNHKLGTLARAAGVPLVDKHAALGDVRAVARLLPRMFETYGQPVHYACSPFTHSSGRVALGRVRPVTRAVELRKGTDGWMQSLMARLPVSTGDVDDAAAEVYLDALVEAVADGKIVGEEAKYLAQLAGDAGMGGAEVRTLNYRFLESMRQAALEDGVLTAVEFKQLATAAKALSVPRYFDDLAPTATVKTTSAGTVEKPKREFGGAGPEHNEQQRSARLERARVALEMQRRGASRTQIAAQLQLSLESVKALLRDAKFYADPDSDTSRLELARAAHAARTAGVTREQFGRTSGLSSGKANEAWRDAAVLMESDRTG